MGLADAQAPGALSPLRVDGLARLLALFRRFDGPAARLKPYGVASLASVAANKTEDGKPKNLPVELVER